MNSDTQEKTLPTPECGRLYAPGKQPFSFSSREIYERRKRQIKLHGGAIPEAIFRVSRGNLNSDRRQIAAVTALCRSILTRQFRTISDSLYARARG
jgi:hypothetical protein